MLYKSVLVFFTILLLTACADPVARNPVARSTGVKSKESFLKESIKRNKLLYKAEKNYIEDYIKKDSLNSYHVSHFNFWYYFIKRDALNKVFPKKGDIVIYNYEIKNLNNKTIYSTKELGLKKYLVDKQDIVSGLRNGIKLMHKGDIVKFIFQSNVAYGYSGDKNKISSNEPLIYIVQLKEIITKNKK